MLTDRCRSVRKAEKCSGWAKWHCSRGHDQETQKSAHTPCPRVCVDSGYSETENTKNCGRDAHRLIGCGCVNL